MLIKALLFECLLMVLALDMCRGSFEPDPEDHLLYIEGRAPIGVLAARSNAGSIKLLSNNDIITSIKFVKSTEDSQTVNIEYVYRAMRMPSGTVFPCVVRISLYHAHRDVLTAHPISKYEVVMIAPGQIKRGCVETDVKWLTAPHQATIQVL